MALDIRLDFISKISPGAMDRMKAIRKMYIDIDEKLCELADQAVADKSNAAGRTAALARTFNEQACQSTIKTLCLLGEIK